MGRWRSNHGRFRNRDIIANQWFAQWISSAFVVKCEPVPSAIWKRRSEVSCRRGIIVSTGQALNPQDGTQYTFGKVYLPVDFDDEEEWSGLDTISPENWLMVPVGGYNRAFVKTPAAIGRPISLKTIPGEAYVEPDPTTVALPKKLVTFGVADPGPPTGWPWELVLLSPKSRPSGILKSPDKN